MSTDELARFMYVRNVESYGDPALIDDMWMVDSVHSFWMGEAQAVLDFIFGRGTF
jgi:hypothetical protein